VNLSFDGNRLKTALKLANKKVYKAADNREDYTGMGTTAVAALISEKVATIGSAGDSRVYLMRNGELKQLTRDDSWVSAAWAEGILSAQEIEKHPLRNVITKAGAKDTIDIEVVEHTSRAGTCSCLLRRPHAMINDDEIRGSSHWCREPRRSGHAHRGRQRGGGQGQRHRRPAALHRVAE
jgi:hypothetical protein